MNKQKTALITGVTGQDGSYLAELLLDKSYKVLGISRRTSTDNTERIKRVLEHSSFTLIEGDITDYLSISKIIGDNQPDEIYNLAAQSHVQTSFEQPSYTYSVNAIGPLNILESVRRLSSHSKIYQASTSELFGSNYHTTNEEFPSFFQDEDTPFKPNSPYGIAKLAAHESVRVYRESYNLFACSGIIFNHESPRRGAEFVTRKITKYIGRLIHHLNNKNRVGFPGPLYLGNLDASRDWSHARDMVRGMHLLLQQKEPKDYVFASGETYTIREFLTLAFSHVGLSWEDFVKIDKKFYRPCEVPFLCGNSSRAKKELGWETKISFRDLVYEMVNEDIKKTK